MSGMSFNYCDIAVCAVAVCTANRIETQKSCTFNPGRAESYEQRCIHCRTNLEQTGINGKSYFHCDNYDAQKDARKHSVKEKKDIEKPKTEEKSVNHDTKRKNKQKQKKRTKSKPLRSQSDIIREKLKKMAI